MASRKLPPGAFSRLTLCFTNGYFNLNTTSITSHKLQLVPLSVTSRSIPSQQLSATDSVNDPGRGELRNVSCLSGTPRNREWEEGRQLVPLIVELHSLAVLDALVYPKTTAATNELFPFMHAFSPAACMLKTPPLQPRLSRHNQ
jgi:hypothetical protein